MAKTRAVWGIDIGNCSLKALRLRTGSAPGEVVADAFDYIEYPKILTQPGAEPGELIQEALKQFLSRNSVRGDRVAISVSGQNGLARFVKLPPVEAKKIPDIVRFEARQQIPFDLNDVVWDYQRMGGGAEEEGFLLETEIGLFAMKRDQVLRALQPFNAAGIPVDFVQLTPLSLYNYVAFDFLTDLPAPEEYNPEDPPPSVVILSLGTDATDLVVTNGFRVWQRSIPLGGNHFTKALTKELKLTFAKAEHLKRNATAAEDPKAVFQAMRPVFNDLLTEVQRSIGYFTSIDRAAKIDRVLALGNAMKLPGLRRYLSQSLGFEVVRPETFSNLSGPEVTAAPAFQENMLCFGVCYGLALQGLNLGSLRTNLLPKEIVKDRLIRRKKPWVAAAAALLLASFAISFGSYSMAVAKLNAPQFGDAERAAKQVIDQCQKFKTERDAVKAKYDEHENLGSTLISNVEGRLLWLEVLKAINACLPSDPEGTRSEDPDDVFRRNEIHLVSVTADKVPDLHGWFRMYKLEQYFPEPEQTAAGAAAAAAAAAGAAAAEDSDVTPEALPGGLGGMMGGFGGTGGGASAPMAVTVAGPTGPDPAMEGRGPYGPGWVFELKGYHYHNTGKSGDQLEGARYVRETLMNSLATRSITLPGPDGKEETISLKELGISCPVLVTLGKNQLERVALPNPFPKIPKAAFDELTSPAAPGVPGVPAVPGALAAPAAVPSAPLAAAAAPKQEIYMYKFTVQFAWQPTPPSERRARKLKAAAANPSGAASPAGEQ